MCIRDSRHADAADTKADKDQIGDRKEQTALREGCLLYTSNPAAGAAGTTDANPAAGAAGKTDANLAAGAAGTADANLAVDAAGIAPAHPKKKPKAKGGHLRELLNYSCLLYPSRCV